MGMTDLDLLIYEVVVRDSDGRIVGYGSVWDNLADARKEAIMLEEALRTVEEFCPELLSKKGLVKIYNRAVRSSKRKQPEPDDEPEEPLISVAQQNKGETHGMK